jgi:hypothetical protein
VVAGLSAYDRPVEDPGEAVELVREAGSALRLAVQTDGADVLDFAGGRQR